MPFRDWHRKAIAITLADGSIFVDVDISGLIMKLMWTLCLICMHIYELALNCFKYKINIVTYISDNRRGFDWTVVFIAHLQVLNANSYNNIADFHTIIHSTQSLLSLFPLVFTWWQLSAMALLLLQCPHETFPGTNGYPSTSVAWGVTLHSWTLVWTQLLSARLSSR
jgi:hypothetical protein